MPKHTNKSNKIILLLLGLSIFYMSLLIVIPKIEDAFTHSKNIFTVDLSVNLTHLIIIVLLCIIFLFVEYRDDKKALKIQKDFLEFVSWVIYIAISAMLIYILLMIFHWGEFSTLVFLIVFFCLFVFYRCLQNY